MTKYRTSEGGYDRNKEIREAIDAGQRALMNLREADRQLGSARNWGIMDTLGGDLISGIAKHRKVNNANHYIENAKSSMRAFQKELSDIRDMPGMENLQVDISGFLTFADFFFDGLIADLLVQSRIRKGQQQIQDAIAQVEQIVRRLRQELR